MDMNIEMDKNTATDSITSRLADARNDLGITQLSRPLTHQRLPPVPPDYPGLALPALILSLVMFIPVTAISIVGIVIIFPPVPAVSQHLPNSRAVQAVLL